MNIIHATGIEGARHARGTVVVIDVLRSFTVSAYALAGGARECRLVKTVAEARALAALTPGAVLCAEEDALPVEGIAISNSPTKILQAELQGRILIQRSTAGTQVAAAVEKGDMWAASLVVARATVQACLLRHPDAITLLASADHPEDHACARYMEAIINGEEPDLENLLERQPELLALPGQGQPVVLIVTCPHPAGQEHLGEIRIALTIGAEDDLHGALEPDG